MNPRIRSAFFLLMSFATYVAGTSRAAAQFHSPTLQPSEARFIQQLYQEVIANQRMAEMAMNKGNHRSVRQLGANVSRDLRYSRENLEILARDERVNLSDVLTASHRRPVSRLSSEGGDAFDRTYVDTLLHDLPPILHESQQIVSRTRNDELRTYLSKVNPRIEHVVGEAQAARSHL